MCFINTRKYTRTHKTSSVPLKLNDTIGQKSNDDDDDDRGGGNKIVYLAGDSFWKRVFKHNTLVIYSRCIGSTYKP